MVSPSPGHGTARDARHRTLPAPVAVILAIFSVAAGAPGAATPEDRWLHARPDFEWSFPRDHWAHPGYRSEWWYLTGHLEAVDDPGRRFGFQFTFFRVGLLPDGASTEASDWAAVDLIMGHAAVGDLANGVHRFAEVLYRAVPLLGGFNRHPVAAIAWSRGPAGTDAPWTLHWNGEAFDVAARDDGAGFAFRLTTQPEKPVVLHGADGFSRKGHGLGTGASQYYSFTRLGTEGTVTLDGETHAVRGVSWMDKEFGSSQLGANEIGWDWFSMQLADGRDVMLYLLRDREGAADYTSGTLVSPEGVPRVLDAGAFSVKALGTWRSPATGAEYPSGWIVELPDEGLRLRVQPEMRDQENRAELGGGVVYWEGAVRLVGDDGRDVGQGYVELTGR